MDRLIKEYKEKNLIDDLHSQIDIFRKKYQDNSFYEGQLKDNNREGNGIYYFKNGDIYMGEWRDDRFNGYGRYIFKTKREMYSGGLKENKKDGYGEY